MNNQTKHQTLLYLVLITLGMLLLATSLSELDFQPGMAIPGAETTQTSANVTAHDSHTQAIKIRLFLQLPLLLFFTVMVIVLLKNLIKKANSKRILKFSGILAAVICAFLLLNQIEFTLKSSAAGDSQRIDILPSFNYEIAPIGEPPENLFLFVMAALVLVAVILIIWVLYQTANRSTKKDLLASEADAALKAIDNGEEFRNVIIRCYVQMAKIAKEEQGIEREDFTTPREFENLLASNGIPIPPIHQLTHLFERVRYGKKTTDLQDEQAARECLSAIQISCKSRNRTIK